MLKPPLRTKSVGTKVSEAEFALLEERARGAGLRLAEWVREALLAAPVEPGMGSGVDSGAVPGWCVTPPAGAEHRCFLLGAEQRPVQYVSSCGVGFRFSK